MNARQFLEQYRQCEARILFRQEKIEALQQRAVRVSHSMGERVQSSPNHGRQGEVIGLYVDLQRELIEELRRFRDLQACVLGVLKKMQNSRQAALLELHYLGGKTLQQVAEILDLSYMQISRIHKQALLGVAEILEVES